MRFLLPALAAVLISGTTLSAAAGPMPNDLVSRVPNTSSEDFNKYPKFDDSRIKHYPDKLLLRRIRTYFKAFTNGDFNGIKALEANGYNMTDIRESLYSCFLLFSLINMVLALGVVRSPKEVWYKQNMGFTNLLTDLRVQAISLHGSSAPGQFAIMEHVVWFTLKADPPEAAKPNLPPGAKKGDKAGMINIAVLWWDRAGKITHELEYGRLTWEGFDITAFDK